MSKNNQFYLHENISTVEDLRGYLEEIKASQPHESE